MTAAKRRAVPEAHAATRESIERAIEHIWERYSEPVSLDELSKSALLSRFHFARTFREITGVTPGRFLSAVRIHQAKRMLVDTPRTITDISSAVGYQSLGSFTNYFTQSVGMPPSQFRHLAEGTAVGLHPSENCSGLRVYVGVFPTPILQSPPIAAKIIDAAYGHPFDCVLPDVPPGTWFVHAVASTRATGPDRRTDQPLFVDRRDAVTVGAPRDLRVSLRLRPRRPTDPPVLLALPDLRPLPTARPIAGRVG
ncbi:helix-turn-helix domain-containing protein [Streptacidiphilus pinicola]|uniref:helix-turn-helix domain-containing protein n=1 Tax=Streptacidiphilus pinicola TaxID=2219663 RepID=UPI001404239D|nr:AraC family transcriptional regulator [Streptacidiphilus pinicola]